MKSFHAMSYLSSERDELGEIFFVIIVEGAHVFTVANKPVNAGEVLSLS